MSPGVIYPGILRRLCKEPLGEVKCVQLRGRGIVRLEGLDSCPNLTSLDVSWNSLKQLDGAGLERCNELWIVDASHNQLVSFPLSVGVYYSNTTVVVVSYTNSQ